MSLAVASSEGVTVLTVTSDTFSVCPPLCQLLGALCYSPGLCGVSRRLLPQSGGPQAALGALWILTGVLHIGLGTILITTRGTEVYRTRDTCCPYWLGVLFVLFGVSCVLTERYPRPILVLLNGLLTLTGFALSITAIVWYADDLGDSGFDFCYKESYYYDRNWRPRPTATPSPEQSSLLERCEETRDFLQVLTARILEVLITLSVLDLCLGISSATLSFKTLKEGLSNSRNKPLLKEDKETSE